MVGGPLITSPYLDKCGEFVDLVPGSIKHFEVGHPEIWLCMEAMLYDHRGNLQVIALL